MNRNSTTTARTPSTHNSDRRAASGRETPVREVDRREGERRRNLEARRQELARRTTVADGETPGYGNVHDFEEARQLREELRREVEQRERDFEARTFGERRSVDRRKRDAVLSPEDEEEVRRERRADHIKRYERRKQKKAEHEARLAAKRANCPACHWGMSVLTLLLIAISMPIIYSASMPVALADNPPKAPNFYVLRQLVFAVLGYGLFVGASKLKPQQMRVCLWVLYFGVLLGLAAMAFTPLGFTQSGVKRWIKIPGMPPQQLSELAKIAIIGVMADFWSRAARGAQKSYWPWLAAAGLTLPVAGLVLIQPHLSAALLLCTLPFVIIWFADVPMKRIGVVLTPIFVCLLLVGGMVKLNVNVPLMTDYQQQRLVSHFGGESDEQGGNYQSLQSQRTLVSGGLLGRGPGQSLGKQGHLPEPHTDFIFAVIGEEFGLVGSLALLSCYGLLIFFCFQIGHVAETMFEGLLCAGVGSLLAIQVVCNIGVVTGVLPVTGMPLPFMSYGGSGLLCVLLGLGLVLGVSRGLGRNSGAAEADAEADETPVRAQPSGRRLQTV